MSGGHDIAREARRTALILAAAQAVLGSGAPICFALGALAGSFMLGADKSLATAPLTGFNIGVALGALPAAAIIRALGHRKGFLTGSLFTALGGLIATIALFQSGFWLFVAGLMVAGVGSAFVQQFRFAAADNAPPEFKARAISFVLAGGIITAILGPQTVIFTHDLLAPVPFAGSFAALIVLAGIGVAILLFLRKESRAGAALATSDSGRPLGEIVMQPRYAVALGCGVAAYSLMTFVMTGAPLAMVGCGFSSDQATLGISWHVMAMFGPSFFTGSLISRFGAAKITAFGLLLEAVAVAIGVSGVTAMHFWGVLIVVGLGWNFSFVGASTLIVETHRPQERNKVQALNDFIVFGLVALGSFSSGQLLTSHGWTVVNLVLLPALAIALLALAASSAMRQRPA